MSWRYVRSADRLTNLTAMRVFRPSSNITLFFAGTVLAAWSFPKTLEAEAAAVVDVEDLDPKTRRRRRGKGCPPYGCPLLPRDMYFDEEANAALKAIRSLMQKDTSPSATSSSTSTSTSLDPSTDEKEDDGELNLSQALDLLKSVGGQDQATLTLIGYKGGKLTEQINQDRAFVLSPYYIVDDPSTPIRLLGVFDGHAKLGELVSEYTVTHLPQLLSQKLESILEGGLHQESSSSRKNSPKGPQHQHQAIQEAIVDSFIEVDRNAPAQVSGGCTASIVLQLGRQVYVANAGDSRSLIATYNRVTSQVQIVHVTREDKPHLAEERARVEKMGGQVYVPTPERSEMGASSRVLFRDKSTGATNGLAMSRSIGDWAAGELGVIPDPTVVALDIQDIIVAAANKSNTSTCNDNGQSECKNPSSQGPIGGDIEVFAVSATDGLLDFIPVEEIAKTVAHSLYVNEGPHPLSACESLITTAASAWWKAKNGRYRDDIAIAVSKLSL